MQCFEIRAKSGKNVLVHRYFPGMCQRKSSIFHRINILNCNLVSTMRKCNIQYRLGSGSTYGYCFGSRSCAQTEESRKLPRKRRKLLKRKAPQRKENNLRENEDRRVATRNSSPSGKNYHLAMRNSLTLARSPTGPPYPASAMPSGSPTRASTSSVARAPASSAAQAFVERFDIESYSDFSAK